MALYIVTQSLAVFLMATTTTSQFMPPPSFPYQFQQGQPPMQMMQMPNGPPMMQSPNGAPMMQMPNSGQVMQMPNGPIIMPHLPRLPGMPSSPMHLPMTFPMSGGRLPMVVMPHHSKKADKPRRRHRKSKRKRINMESSSSEGSCSESVEYRRSSRSKVRPSSKTGRKREVLTPVVSYVTKDGFVVYQKKIKKDKARDWLEMTKGDGDHDSKEFRGMRSHDHDH